MNDPSLPVIVVPCFNEERRLDTAAFAELADSGRIRLLFVDDGSRDGTPRVLGKLAESSPGIDILELIVNGGKGEAIRHGMRRALEGGANVTGYYDADLATPPRELLRLVAFLADHPALEVVMGSRVRLLGRSIARNPARHYLGRVFATLASLALGVPVYDTQCGAKVFRATDALTQALQTPFRSRWAFDVELIGRLLKATGDAPPLRVDAFAEVPLLEYRNVGGSKLRFSGMLGAVAALLVIAVDLRRSRM